MAQASVAAEPQPSRRPRYREERTLVRRLLRFPGQSKEDFRQKIRQLREAFQQFNADVAGVCQWAIRFRPRDGQPAQPAHPFWSFFLDPEAFVPPNDTRTPDFRRLQAFDAATGIGNLAELPDPPFTLALRESIQAAAAIRQTHETQKLTNRLKNYLLPHRMIVLKAAAEWIQARYERGYQNWLRQHAEWEKEKQEWEQKHPALTPEIRDAFNQIFQQLGVKEKRPRICPLDHLRQNKDNCKYAGEQPKRSKHRHSPLCLKFAEFCRQKLDKNAKQYFYKDAQQFLNKGLRSLKPRVQKSFKGNWHRYLQFMNLKEDTIRKRYGGQLPHCEKLGQECQFNPHTDLCKQYKSLLAEKPELAEQEKLYREWRSNYWRGPRKPDFRYPSARLRSTPKIFGEKYFTVDFQKSVVGLRLDSMPEGQYLEFAFAPWPSKYTPQPHETTISSVHLHFAGTRPRIGFRFSVKHKASRFACSQDELDELRSRQFPRKAQDQQFLDAARDLLLKNNFNGEPEQELRILAVDLGTSSAQAAFFVGKNCKETHPLKIVKIEKLYDQPPKTDDAAGDAGKKKYRLGLSKDHVGRHLEEMGRKASEIAKKRNELRGTAAPEQATLRPSDLRGLAGHTARMIRDWARLNARQIIQLAEEKRADLIVLESLRGFRPQGYDNPDLEKKRRVAFFAYGRIRRKLAEKAVERGMRVVTVPYLYSSKVCSKCGRRQDDEKRWNNNKQKGRFECEHRDCGYKAQTDENAARVLGRVFWGEINLPASRA